MRFERVGPAEEAQFDQLVRLYEEALPAGERKSVGALRAMLRRPEYIFLTAIEDEHVIGFAIAIALVASDAALLEYMAVDSHRRGMGIGAALFRAIARWPGVTNRVLLIEVDSDREDAAQREQSMRRKAFYRRLGARELAGVPYIMPPVTAALPPPMDLLVYGRELPERIDKGRVHGWMGACYAQVYGMASDDPRIDVMLASCAEYIALV